MARRAKPIANQPSSATMVWNSSGPRCCSRFVPSTVIACSFSLESELAPMTAKMPHMAGGTAEQSGQAVDDAVVESASLMCQPLQSLRFCVLPITSSSPCRSGETQRTTVTAHQAAHNGSPADNAPTSTRVQEKRCRLCGSLPCSPLSLRWASWVVRRWVWTTGCAGSGGSLGGVRAASSGDAAARTMEASAAPETQQGGDTGGDAGGAGAADCRAAADCPRGAGAADCGRLATEQLRRGDAAVTADARVCPTAGRRLVGAYLLVGRAILVGARRPESARQRYPSPRRHAGYAGRGVGSCVAQ
eukprot:ctg_167.g106